MLELLYHGHSFVEIVTATGSILIDPFITGNPSCAISFDECAEKNVRMVVVTHGHDDHLGDAFALCKKTGALLVCTYELGKWAEKEGVAHVSMHGIGGMVRYDDATAVKFTQALHGGAESGSGLGCVAAGVLVYVEDKTIFHAGDSGLTIEYELLGRYETIDCAFLPIGDRFTMGVTDAIRATAMIQPTYVVPIHYNTWPLIKVDPTEFARGVMLENYAVPKVLNPGQLLALS